MLRSEQSTMSQDYNATINLPKTDFPMRAGLPKREPEMLKRWQEQDVYNELLKKNAAALKQGPIEAAKESERGIVDIETLQQTNKSLIETLDELNKIQSEGRAKRQAAEQELTRIEDELKQKMMEIRG